MRDFNFLGKLRDAQPGNVPFISLYLNTSPNETGKREFSIFLKKQLKDHLAVIELGSDKHTSFEKSQERILEFVDDLDPSTKGIAIFARSGEGDIFKTFEFAVPFEENHFYLFDRPYVFPLVRLIDQHPRFVVAAADTNSAHIYMIGQAEIINRADIQNTKTNRSEVGGWSQMRYQRHIENFHQQHAKEVVEELEKLVRDHHIERVVVIGDQAVILPLLREQMSKELGEKVVDSLALNVNTPEHELVEAAREAVAHHNAEADKKAIENLLEVNYDGGEGVTGFADTFAAVWNGQVQELYLSADPSAVSYRTEDIKLLLKTYAPGSDTNFPEARDNELLIDELIKQASRSADRISFIEDPHLLKTAGGIGALLRYQAKGVSSS